MFKICAFYTPEYSDEVTYLLESCHRFGYEYFTKEYSSTGNWRDNTYIKPEFILECLNNFDEDVLYLDADAVIKSKLTFFDTMSGDVAFFTVPWNANESNKTLSGTMYFKNNEASRKFLESWIQKRLVYPKLHGDQALIPKVLADNLGTIITQLPFEYVKIFDRKYGGPPVIQHNQASRRLKNKVNKPKRNSNVENRKLKINNYQYSTVIEDTKYSNLHRDLLISSLAERVGRWALDRVTKTLPKVIDIGCGSGLLRAFVPYQYYVGVDIASKLIDSLKKTAAENEKFYHDDASQFNTEEHYDIAYCVNTLQHLPEEFALEALKRLCSISDTQIISVQFKRDRSVRAHDNAELTLTIQEPMWWEGTISHFTEIREKRIMGNSILFYCGAGYKSPNELANLPFKVHRRSDGGFKLLRANREREKYLDERFNRLANTRVWYPRVDEDRVVSKLKDKGKDKCVYIIGKGPSLDHLEPNMFEDDGPVLAINESVNAIHKLGLRNHIYLVQQDMGLGTHPEQSVILHERSKHLHPQVEDRYIFNKRDFSSNSETVSGIIAIRIAILMGAKKIVLISFDASTTRETGYAQCIGHQPRTIQLKGPERFLAHKKDMLIELGKHKVDWITPLPL